MILRVITLALLILAALAVSTSSLAQDKPLTEDDIKALVHDYIMENPEVVVEAIQNWQQAQQLARMLPQINLYRGFLERDPSQPVLGNPDGDVTIVELFDYQCPFCKRHYPVVKQVVEDDTNVRYVVRHFVVKDKEGQPPVSLMSALAAQAAHKQGKFAAFHDLMMSDTGKLTEDRIYENASAAGLDVEQLKRDMRDPLFEKNIRNTLSVARDIGFTGTPAYIVGNEVVLGAQGPQAMAQAIIRARADAQEAAAAGR